MARRFTSDGLYTNNMPVSAWPITLSFWTKLESTGTSNPFAIWFDDKDAGGINNLIYRHTTASSFSFWTGNAATEAIGPTSAAPDIDVWYHVCLVVSGNTSRIVYVDASPGTEKTTSYVWQANADRFAFGGAGDSSPTWNYVGKLAEVGVWNVALTPAEVTALAKGYAPSLVRPSGLKMYFPFVRDEDRDLVQGYSLTAVNSPEIADHPRIIYPGRTLVVPNAGGGAPPAGGFYARRYYDSLLSGAS